jgi:hypothetical protein
MADTREDIMAQLVSVLEDIPGVSSVLRNQLMDDDTTANAIVVLEGDEMIDDADQAATRNRPPNSPIMMHMQPQLYIRNFDKAATVGTGLSALRAAVIKAVTGDVTLAGLTVKGRGGIYLGMESDLAFAREMAGQMALKFQFTYVLRPDQF